MNRFEYVRPGDASPRPSPPRAAPGAAYLAAGTNLLDLMKGGVSAPGPPGRRHAPARARPHRAPGRWRRAHRRAGAQCRPRARRRLRQRLSGGGRSAAVGRLGAAAQRRDGRRQSAAADALRVFLRRRQRLQQTRARRRLRRASAARTACTPCSAGARPASPRTRPISACRWSRSTPWSRSRAGAAGARSRSKTSIACPATTPERETVLEPGDLIVARAPAGRGARLRRACALSEGPRAHLLRLRRRLGRRRAAHRGRHDRARRGSRSAASPPSPGAPARRKRCWPARAPDAAAFRRAAEAALADAKPSGDNAFKIELARRIVVRALTLAAAGTPDAHARPARLALRVRSGALPHA